MSADDLPADLLDLIAKHWGFRELRPLQEQAIAAVLQHRDSLVVLPTGGGKSLCYQAPAIFRGGLTVVVSPLIALMKDQVDGLARNGVHAVRLDSTLTTAEWTKAMDDIRTGQVRLAFTSPERLVNTETHRVLQAAGTTSVAIDEAHCVSHWGHDFRPEYRQLGRLREFFPQASIHGYTATANEQVRRDIALQLGLNDPQILIGNFDRPNLTYRVIPQVELIGQIREVLDRHPGDAGIVYCLRRKDVDSVTAALVARNYKAVRYHAGMAPNERKRNHDAFATEEADVVVATIAFGMGIDRSNVRFVIHAAVPKSIEHYQQETGRAGRDSLPSECVLLYSGADVMALRSIIQKSASEANVAPEITAATLDQLDEMSRYARGAICRHKAIVNYFGQRYERANCGACDLCLGDTQEIPDATVIAQKILSCVARVKENYGINHVIDVLRGASTESVRSRGHDKLSTYGILHEPTKADLRDWIYQIMGQDALVQSEGDYPILKLNAASWEVLRGTRTVRLIRLVGKASSTPGTHAPAAGSGTLSEGADPQLFEYLRVLRRNEAARILVQPYQVFTDAVLVEFARARPSTLQRMHMISGVGEQKLREFGQTFLNAIVEQSQKRALSIDVPATASSRVRTAPVVSGKMTPRKLEAFEAFRSGASVEEAVNRTGLSRSTICDFLVDFIRLERPPSPFRWVSEAICERVAAAAEVHGNDKMKPVFLALNEEIPYEQIRIVLAFLDNRG